MRLKEIEPGMVIHCKTEEELKTLLNELTVLGYVWWSDGTPPKRFSLFAPILINTYEDSGVGKNITYSMVGEKKNYTEFSDLIIPELSAKEVLEIMREICENYENCKGCPLRRKNTHNLCHRIGYMTDSDLLIDICTKWREEHPKEEKKELETEWVYVVRIIKVHDNGKKECVMEIEEGESRDGIEDRIENDLKLYIKNHDGNFFATLEHICRIKE